jgi:hypothetical protein
MGALLYFGLKFVAYTTWCYLGLSRFRGDTRPSWTTSVCYGLVRLFMGLFFGVVIWFASSVVLARLGYGLPQNVLTYLLVYVPVRWVEWTIMALIILPGSFPFWRWAVCTGARDRLWRLGGIAISCLADIPLILSLGGVIPTGRFLC